MLVVSECQNLAKIDVLEVSECQHLVKTDVLEVSECQNLVKIDVWDQNVGVVNHGERNVNGTSTQG